MVMLTNLNLIHARAAIQVDIEEGCDIAYATETAQIVYELTIDETIDIVKDIKESVWYKNRSGIARN